MGNTRTNVSSKGSSSERNELFCWSWLDSIVYLEWSSPVALKNRGLTIYDDNLNGSLLCRRS